MTSYITYQHLTDAPAHVYVPLWLEQSDLSHVRSLARSTLKLSVPVPGGLAQNASMLLASDRHELFASYGINPLSDGETYDDLAPTKEEMVAANNACAVVKELVGTSIESLTVATCREQSFHHDEVNSSTHAYIAWVLDSSHPMSFHTRGACIDLKPGDLIIFDAHNPHALLRTGVSEFADDFFDATNYRFVFALGIIELTPALYKLLDMEVLPVPVEDVRWMRNVDYSEATGEYLNEKTPQSEAFSETLGFI